MGQHFQQSSGRLLLGRRPGRWPLARWAALAALLGAAAGCSEESTTPVTTTASGSGGSDGGTGGTGGDGGDGGDGGAGGGPGDRDGDSYLDDEDCQPDDPLVHPGALEVCDGIDNDCDDQTDGADALGAIEWFRDQDEDGWGVSGETVMACDPGAGWALQVEDCDDEEATVYPGAPELCDLLDNDCDGYGDVPAAAAISPVWGTYYLTADLSSAATLRPSLHDIIDDHTFVPYTSSSTDTWDVLELASEHPGDSTRVLDVYKNASYPKHGGGNPDYDREHAWPQSYLPNDSDHYPHTDCHHLFLADFSYNASRGNLPFDVCAQGCEERPTDVNDNQGGGTGVYPGNSNWRKSDTWEIWMHRRGDVARALLYLDVRYEGGTHGGTSHAEPDLILTDDRNLIVTSASTDTVAYMGLLSTLLIWHCEDPVDAEELHHHDTVVAHQGNRNPFVDHPEWAACLFLDQCGD